MPIQQLQFKTSVFTGTAPKKSVGEGLVNLIYSGMDLKQNMNKVDEKIKSDNLESDGLLYSDMKVKFLNFANENDYDNADGFKQEELLNKFKEENPIEFSSQEFGNKRDLFFGTAQSNVQKKQYDGTIEEVNKNVIPTLAQNIKAFDMEDIDLYSKHLSESGVKRVKEKLLAHSVNNIDDYVYNNREALRGKTKKEIESMFPVLKEIKDEELKKKAYDTINKIDANTKAVNYDNSLTNLINLNKFDNIKELTKVASINNKSVYDIREDIRKKAKSVVDVMSISDDERQVQKAIGIANQFGLKFNRIENFISDVENIDSINPENSFEGFVRLQHALNNGYTPSGSTDTYEAILSASETLGIDLRNKENNNKENYIASVELLKQGKELGYKAISRTEFDKINFGLLFGGKSDNEKNFIFKKMRAYSKFFDRDKAQALAEEALEKRPLVGSGAMNSDYSGTLIKSDEDAEILKNVLNKKYPRVEISGVERYGDMFILKANDGEAGQALTVKELDNLVRQDIKEKQDRLTKEAIKRKNSLFKKDNDMFVFNKEEFMNTDIVKSIRETVDFNDEGLKDTNTYKFAKSVNKAMFNLVTDLISSDIVENFKPNSKNVNVDSSLFDEDTIKSRDKFRDSVETGKPDFDELNKLIQDYYVKNPFILEEERERYIGDDRYNAYEALTDKIKIEKSTIDKIINDRLFIDYFFNSMNVLDFKELIENDAIFRDNIEKQNEGYENVTKIKYQK